MGAIEEDLKKIRKATEEIIQILKPNLKDCPFCGNSYIGIEKHIHGRLFAHCLNQSCGVSSGFCDSENEVVLLWNKRKIEVEKNESQKRFK